MTVLETARRVVATGTVCDACLGRCVGGLSHGLTNAARGRSLRVTLALEEDVPFEDVVPDDCWVCEGLAGSYDEWADRATSALAPLEFESYLVGSRPPEAVEENERTLWKEATVDEGPRRPIKSEVNREVGKRIGDATDANVDFETPDVVVILDVEEDAVDLQMNPAYVYGRYRKLERGIGQRTRDCRACRGRGVVWAEGSERECNRCGGTGRLTERSVEHLLSAPVRDAMEGSGTAFHVAGREYPDVLMLGEGRPFVVEVKEPRVRTPDLDDLSAAIEDGADGAVEVDGLAFVSHDVVERITQLPIDQTYRLTVSFSDAVDADAFSSAVESLEGATVHQTLETRAGSKEVVRMLGDVDGSLEDDRTATVELRVESGIDVAGIVTGSDGDTRPSLAASLDVEATVESLDVVAVEGRVEPLEPPPQDVVE